ncbi:19134_t:CDS:2, partial [Gigaspora margarita]
VAKSRNSALTKPLVQIAAKASGRKQSIKRTLLGLAYKCVELVNYDNLNSKIIEDNDQIINSEYDQIIDNDEGSEILENEVVEHDQIAEITLLDI